MNAAENRSTADEHSTSAVPGKARACRAHGVMTLLKCSAALAVPVLAGCDTRSFIDPGEMVRGGHPTQPPLVPILKNRDPSVEEFNGDFVRGTQPRAEGRAPQSCEQP